MLSPPSGGGPLILHASAVAIDGRGLLIAGRAGSGKSSLALQLMALGADLVSDDRVEVTPRENALILSAPESIAGLVEARGLGILATKAHVAHAVAMVDMDQIETKRLPESRETTVAGIALPLLRRVEGPAFAPMLRLYLKGGLAET